MKGLVMALVVGSLVIGLSGCATATGGGGGLRDTITREQMLEVNANDAYDAVQKLQPDWLTSRGPTSITDGSPSVVSVFVSGSHVGDAEFLRSLRPDDIQMLRHYDAGEASARFGMGHPRGVIEVHLR